VQEFVDEGDEPESDIVHRQFVVAGAERAVLLVPAHDPFNQVATPIGSAVKGLLPRLILASRDDGGNMVPVQPLADTGVAVAFVPRDLSGPARVPCPPGTLCPEHHGREGSGLMALARSDPDGQHGTVALTDEVHLGAKPALRAAQGVVWRLWEPQLLWPG
jgi:hypothetical protein